MLYWLFRHKNFNPVDIYLSSAGAKDLLAAFAQIEIEDKDRPNL